MIDPLGLYETDTTTTPKKIDPLGLYGDEDSQEQPGPIQETIQTETYKPSMWERASQGVKRVLGGAPPGYMRPKDIAEAQIAHEAQKENLTPYKYKTKVLPAGAPERRIDRLAKGIGGGAISTLEGMAGLAEWLTNGAIGKDLADQAQRWREDLSPDDTADFSDTLSSGVGSMATFFIPGLGIAGATGKLASVAPKIAMTIGSSAAAVMEAATEAGFNYRQVLQETNDINKAQSAATKTFWGNMPLLLVTNKLGVFGDRGGKVARTLSSAGMEGSQEAGQEIISTKAAGKPIEWGNVLESGGVGAITGGMMHVGPSKTRLGGQPAQKPTTPITPVDRTAEVINGMRQEVNAGTLTKDVISQRKNQAITQLGADHPLSKGLADLEQELSKPVGVQAGLDAAAAMDTKEWQPTETGPITPPTGTIERDLSSKVSYPYKAREIEQKLSETAEKGIVVPDYLKQEVPRKRTLGGPRNVEVQRQTETENVVPRAGEEITPPPLQTEKAASPVQKEITYEDFSKMYRDAFDKSQKYTPRQAGFNVYTDTMAKLADNYPEYLERFEAEEEKKTYGKKAPPTIVPVASEGQDMTNVSGEGVTTQGAPRTSLTTRFYTDNGSVGSFDITDKVASKNIARKNVKIYDTFAEADSARKEWIKEDQTKKAKEKKTEEDQDYINYQQKEQTKKDNDIILNEFSQLQSKHFKDDWSGRNRMAEAFSELRKEYSKKNNNDWWDKPLAEKQADLKEFEKQFIKPKLGGRPATVPIQKAAKTPQTFLEYARNKVDFNIIGHSNKRAIADGLLRYTKRKENGGLPLDKFAQQAQSEGMLGPTPDDYPSAGDYAYDLMVKSIGKQTKVLEEVLTEEENQAIKEEREAFKNEGYSEEDITAGLSEAERNLAEEVSAEALSRTSEEIEGVLDDVFVAEEEPTEEKPPEKQPKKRLGGELFDTSSMFTLSGNQPLEQKTMRTAEKKGERVLDVNKKTTDELKEILSGEEDKKALALRSDANLIYNYAMKNIQPVLDRVGKEIADSVGGKYNGNVKSVKSIIDKVTRKQAAGEKYTVLSPKDHARGMITASSIEDLPGIIDSLQRRGFVVENTIDEPLNRFGYRGLNATTKIGDLGGEIQIHTKETADIKKVTDLIYRDWRDYTDKDVAELDLNKRDAYKADVEKSIKMWSDYWGSLPAEAKAPISSSLKGLDSVTAPNLMPLGSSQEPSLPETIQRPPSPIKNKRPSLSFETKGNLFGINQPPKEIITPKEEAVKSVDLTDKSLSELVTDAFAIINEHIGDRGSISLEKIDKGLYEKLKPILAEIAKRAVAKGYRVRDYMFGAVDSQPEGKAKQIYEAAARQYNEESENEHYNEPAKKEETKKEPWEMTKDQYLDAVKAGIIESPSEFGAPSHERLVWKAIQEGKTVPEEVLKDYPDLTKKEKSDYDYGKAAFERGVKGAPALDKEFMKTLTGKAGSNRQRMTEWLKGWTEANIKGKTPGSIGKNSRGEDIFEDARGVRSIVDHGVRIQEPVGLIPTRGGIQIEIEHKHERFIPVDKAMTEAEFDRWVAKDEAPATRKIADWVTDKLSKGEAFTREELFKQADNKFKGTQAEGKYTAKDAFDALELGINRYILKRSGVFDPSIVSTPEAAQSDIDDIRKEILNRIPSMSGLRTEEMDEFQQFSTPPDLAFTMAWVANIEARDTVLEPSAGIGGIAVFAKNAGAKVIVNELSSRRADILMEMNFDEVLTENAEQIYNILAGRPVNGIKRYAPTVVLMNPPFSSTGGRVKGERSSKNVIQHLDQALKLLQPNGRMVALIGKGWFADPRAVSDYFTKIKQEYNLRAIITVGGKGYAKYGTTYDNRILVIDKTAPENKPTIEASVEDVKDAIPILREVRDARTYIPEQQQTESEGQKVSPGSRGATESGLPLLPATGKVGVGEREGGNGPQGTGKPIRTVRGEAGTNNEVAPEKSGRTDGTRKPAEWVEGTERPRVSGSRTASGTSDADIGIEPTTPDGLTLEKQEKQKPTKELSDSVYEVYHPQKVKIRGAKAHPGKLVESAAMAIVDPPEPTYSPRIPEKLIEQGKFSDAQLEAIVYAGQAHQEMLSEPVLNAERKETGKFYRRGYFIGDGTGVGKGREIAGILRDNFNQGRKKAIWISQNKPLINDAQRDIEDTGWKKELVFDVGKTKLTGAIARPEGIAFIGYDTLKSKNKENGSISRVNQLVEWFGKDFDGVLVFDESHNLGNAIAIRGRRGTSKPSAKAIAGVELQRLLPNARVVYVSATGATEVMNLAYADRLGLWGEGTPFSNKNDFVTKISAGGIAAMEFVARDLKAMGNYLARSLSYDDVGYEVMEHKLTSEQRVIYDELATAWQGVLADVEAALDLTGGAHNGDAVSSARSKFWGTLQRFFNQIITSMKTPSVVQSIEQDIKSGHAVVIQLVNTNESSQNRALSKMEEEDELEDLDLTPRDQFMEYVKNSFPVGQYQEIQDPNDPDRTIWVPVLDSNGNIVENPEAVEKRDELLIRLGTIRVPDGPLEMILNHFGHKSVAEVTGRTRRVIEVDDEKGHHRIIEKRSQAKALADADAFLDDKKSILIFSYAGGTGRSYHADLTKKNQRLRRHYLLQAGWRADRAIQGFGRTHRSNEKQAPQYIATTTDIIGEKRFVSSIARRLDQLGALTKGERKTGSGGFFTARDNLESEYAEDAIERLVKDIYYHQVPGWNISDFIQQTGLVRLVDKRDGALVQDAIPPVTQFLNRMLAMNLDKQVEIFDLFSQRMDENIRRAMEAGSLDVGLETLRAKKIEKAQEQTVHVDERSGAETKYVQLDITKDAQISTFDDIQNKSYAASGFYKNIKSGQVWAAATPRTETNARTGELSSTYKLRGPKLTAHSVDMDDILDPEKYEKLSKSTAKALWDDEYDALPKEVTYQEHLITGALLPIWDRLPETASRIMRVQTTDGERMIGRLIDPRQLTDTLKKLGATNQNAASITPEDILNNVKEHGFTIELANGWKMKRSKIEGEYRIELIGPEYQHMDQIKRYGVFLERVGWQTRYFIPTTNEGINVIKKIVETRPVVNSIAPLGAREDLGKTSPSFKKSSTTPYANIDSKEHRAEVYGWVGYTFQKMGWDKNVKIEVIQNRMYIPENQIKAGNLTANDRVWAWYDPSTDTTFINAEAFADQETLNKVLIEEVILHRGVSAVFDDAANKFEKQQTYGLVYRTFENDPEMKHVLRDYDLDSTKLSDQITAGKEYMAHHMPQILEKPTVWKRLVLMFRNMLKRLGIKIDTSKEDIETFLRKIVKQSIEFTKGQAEATQGAQAVYKKQSVADTFFSQLLDTIETKLNDMPSKAQSIIPWLQKNQVKPMELEEMGVDKWLRENQKDGKIDKAAFAQWVKDNQIEVKEITKSDTTVFDNARQARAYFTDVRQELGGTSDPYVSGRPLRWMIKDENGEPIDVPERFHEGLDSATEAIQAEEDYQDPDEFSGISRSEEGPKFAGYKLPGGENYREMLFTLPGESSYKIVSHPTEEGYAIQKPDGSYIVNGPKTAAPGTVTLWGNKDYAEAGMAAYAKDQYRSPHWSEPNVLGHVRMQDFTDTEGNKVLLVEEVQSDWHQQGKKEGYVSSDMEAERTQIRKEITALGLNPDTTSAKGIREAGGSEKLVQDFMSAYITGKDPNMVPPAPFRENWHEYLMKRMIRYAAENGYSKIAWTTGEQQAERYDLSKQVERISWDKNDVGTYEIGFTDKSGKQSIWQDGDTKAEDLENIIGKELAKQIIESKEGGGSFSGLDLKVGGTGMKTFYDQKIMGFMNRYVKQWGAKVGEADLLTEKGIGEKVTSAMLEHASELALEDGEISIGTFLHHQATSLTETRDYSYGVYNTNAWPGSNKTPADYMDKVRAYIDKHETVHSIPITPAMKEAVLYEGQPLYKKENKFNEAFWKWFGKSKVVDEKGEPLVVYHGTSGLTPERVKGLREAGLEVDDIGPKGIAEFKTPAWFGYPVENFSKWTSEEGGPYTTYQQVLPVYLSIKNPYRATQHEIQNKPYNDEWVKDKRKQGYDGAVWKTYSNASEQRWVYVAFSPSQIKSVYNQGTWNPQDERISFKKEKAPDDWQALLDSFRKELPPDPGASPESAVSWMDDQGFAAQTVIEEKTDFSHPYKKFASESMPNKQPAATFAERLLKNPLHIDHKVFQQIRKLFQRDRGELFHEYLIDIIGKKGENNSFELSTKLQKEDPKAYQLFSDLLTDVDVNYEPTKEEHKNYGLLLSNIAGYMRGKGATDEIIEVWKAHRASYDQALDRLVAPMKELLAELKEKAKDRLFKDTEKDTITKIQLAIADMGRLKGTYAPRIREDGNYAITARIGQDEDTRYIREHMSKGKAYKRAGQLQKEGWKNIKVEEVNKLSEEVYLTVKPADVAKYVDHAIEKIKADGTLDTNSLIALSDELINAVADTVKERGALRHKMQRGKGHVEGYITDANERLLKYATSVSGGLSKAEVSRNAVQLLSEIDATKEKRISDYSTKYVMENLRNPDYADRWIGIGKTIAAAKYLTSPKTWFVNSTAMVTTVPPAMRLALGKDISFARIITEESKASKDFVKHMTGGTLKNDIDERFVQEMTEKGHDNPQFVHEMMEGLKGGKGYVTKAMKVAMWGMQQTERFNRGATMLASFRIAYGQAKKQGMNDEKAYQYAKEKAESAMEQAHAMYGKANLPEWAWGTAASSKIGQTLYMYGNFGHNYSQMLYNSGFKKGSRNTKAFLWAVMAPTILAGAGAFPFYDNILWAFSKILSALGFDDDPERFVWDAIRDHLGKYAEQFGRYGLTGLADMDITGSLSVGVGVPRNLKELAGPIGGVADDLLRAGHYVKVGKYGRAIETIMPRPIEAVISAVRERVEGVTTRTGRRVYDEQGKPLMPTTGDTIRKAFGFRSAEQATLQDRIYEAKKEEGRQKDRRDDIYEMVRDWEAKYPQGNATVESQRQWKKIMKLTDNYNKSAGDNPKINKIGIRRQANSMRRPSRQEKRRLQQGSP